MVLAVLWFGVSLPLVFFGAFLGYKKDVLTVPVQTNPIPRQIPPQVVFLANVRALLPYIASSYHAFLCYHCLWTHFSNTLPPVLPPAAVVPAAARLSADGRAAVVRGGVRGNVLHHFLHLAGMRALGLHRGFFGFVCVYIRLQLLSTTLVCIF